MMYKSGGSNVDPVEVEAAIAAMPFIAEAGVVGVPDAKWGEVGHAFIVLKETSVRDAELATSEILANLAVCLANYKIPKHITVLSALPRLPIGKIDRAELLRQAISGQADMKGSSLA
jgi:fatty-acyl-CoA synthase